MLLLIGAIGVGNTTLVAVLERRYEIGLRRDLGVSRSSILSQFLMESGMLGLLGGMLGTIVGLVVGAYPAIRAARLEPVTALAA